MSEISIKDYLVGQISEIKQKIANADVDFNSLQNDIIDSFLMSGTEAHYVTFFIFDPIKRMTPEFRESLIKKGYYRQESENERDNIFFIAKENSLKVITYLTKDGLCVETHMFNNGQTCYVVTLNGIKNSLFPIDYEGFGS